MTSVLDPFLYSRHHDPASSQSKLHKARSHGALLSTVNSLARAPAAALGRFAGSLRAVPEVRPSEFDSRRAVLLLDLQNAADHAAWHNAALELDALEGNNAWKHELETDEYDYALVRARLKDLDDARTSCDPRRMLFLIRTALTRHLGGMGSRRLYRHSRVGTKALIERYIESALETISTLIEMTRQQPASSTLGLDSRFVMEQILAARQAFGRSALLLSGGGTFGMNHIGVVKALWDAHFLPRIISGASAGSIVASVLCSRTDDELPECIDEFCYGDLAVFTRDPADATLTGQFVRFLKHGSLFDVTNLQRVMRNLLGDMTFQEAYNRTRRILNICVSSAGVYELPRLLNYITAPNVVVWSAVQSSCSVPFVFAASPLLAKDPRSGDLVEWNPMTNAWIDGSVDNDLPMTRLAELFNVNHFIVSQVNPHVVPFLDRNEDAFQQQNHHEPDDGQQQQQQQEQHGPEDANGWLHKLADVARGEAMHRMHVLTELGVFPTLLTKTMSILSQRYSGDINILPEVPYSQFPKVLTNPTTEFMLEATLAGQRAAWPKLCRVQNHCAIELALDDAVQQLRARIAFSPSQTDLRLQHSTTTTRAGRPTATFMKKSASGVRQQRVKLQSSKSFHNIDSKVFSHAQTPALEAGASALRPRRSIHSAEKPLSPKSESKPVSEEEKMFSTTPNDSSTEDGDDEDEEEEEDYGRSDASVQQDDDYFSVPLRASMDATPALWPSTRQLFPHASQPNTPVPRTRSTQSSPRPPPTASANPAFAMTPASNKASASLHATAHESSSPESDLAAAQSHSRSPPRPPTPHAPHAPLEIDMSGTRGLVLRKRRSLSSGFRALVHPRR